MRLHATTLCLSLLALILPSGRRPPDLIPLEDFFRNSEMSAFKLSPSGDLSPS